MESLFSNILLIIFILIVLVSLFYLALKLLKKANTPTWKGIIISAIVGLLPLYLVLCVFGIMGREKE